jgi:hypothetical protein
MAQTEDSSQHRAGLFDIRFIIGALIGIYGVILVIAGLFVSDSQQQKADGLNVNLWAGLGMVAVSVFFVVWTRMRPIVVPDHIDHDDDRPAGH